MEVNQIICGDCLEVMKGIDDDYINLTVTSPPYDNLRTYNGYTFNFEGIAKELYRITKRGRVVVWVVGDETINGSETGTSFKQVLYFKEIGFNLHDTMIYKKINPLPSGSRRYIQSFEYMFVLSKNKPIIFNPIKQDAKDYREKGKKSTGRQKDGSLKDYRQKTNIKVIRQNVFEYKIGLFNTTKDKIAFQHPAMFPEQLAQDHILSWSDKGDIILDPMCGSGTTCKMAKKLGRKYIGIDTEIKYCELSRRRVNATPEPLF